PAVGLTVTGRSRGDLRPAQAAADAFSRGPSGASASQAGVEASGGQSILVADVPAGPASIAPASPASPPAPVPSGPAAFGTAVRMLPIATVTLAPSFLITTDPTTPLPLQNAPPVFDAALGAWEDEESLGFA
ncbi:MAG TPA: hypothetical protein VGH33_07305, partial [Isosphaeraceae bacterium]